MCRLHACLAFRTSCESRITAKRTNPHRVPQIVGNGAIPSHQRTGVDDSSSIETGTNANVHIIIKCYAAEREKLYVRSLYD